MEQTVSRWATESRNSLFQRTSCFIWKPTALLKAEDTLLYNKQLETYQRIQKNHWREEDFPKHCTAGLIHTQTRHVNQHVWNSRQHWCVCLAVRPVFALYVEHAPMHHVFTAWRGSADRHLAPLVSPWIALHIEAGLSSVSHYGNKQSWKSLTFSLWPHIMERYGTDGGIMQRALRKHSSPFYIISWLDIT